jgi:hypothetical protein
MLLDHARRVRGMRDRHEERDQDQRDMSHAASVLITPDPSRNLSGSRKRKAGRDAGAFRPASLDSN